MAAGRAISRPVNAPADPYGCAPRSAAQIALGCMTCRPENGRETEFLVFSNVSGFGRLFKER